MLKYIEGDLFKVLDKTEKPVVIPHCCNNLGLMGSGFVVPLNIHFPQVKVQYQKKHAESPLQLGETQFINVRNNPEIIIANMIAQEGVGFKNGPPIRYEALQKCMTEIAEKTDKNAIIIAPMFGAFLAGGDWNIIEKMIKRTWYNLDVNIHYLTGQLPNNWNLPSNLESVMLKEILALI